MDDDKLKAFVKNDEEQCILSACLMDPEEAFPRVNSKLSAGSFYSRRHQALYKAMRAIYDRGETLDPITLVHQLERDGQLDLAGGKDYIGYLIDVVPSASGVLTHATIVADAERRRAAARLSRELKEAVSDPSVEVDKAVQAVFSKLLPLAMKDGDTGYRRLDPYTVLKQIEERGNAPQSAIRTGFDCIDNVFYGFRPGEFIVIGGSAKSGKTSWTLNLALNIAEAGHGVGFQSCEMSRDALTERLLNATATVHVIASARGKMSPEEWDRASRAGTHLSKLPFEVDDTAMPDIDDVCAKVMALKAKMPHLKAIIVDFLQLITTAHSSRNEAGMLTHISYRLKSLAKTAEVVLIAPTQLNYKQIDGDQREPELRDLQGSSGMAQAADAVFLCWRSGGGTGPMAPPEYFHINCAASRRTQTFRSKLLWEGRYFRVKEQAVNGVIQ